MKVMILINYLKSYRPLKKSKINNILLEKYKDRMKNPNFEQDY